MEKRLVFGENILQKKRDLDTFVLHPHSHPLLVTLLLWRFVLLYLQTFLQPFSSVDRSRCFLGKKIKQLGKCFLQIFRFL